MPDTNTDAVDNLTAGLAVVESDASDAADTSGGDQQLPADTPVDTPAPTPTPDADEGDEGDVY